MHSEKMCVFLVCGCVGTQASRVDGELPRRSRTDGLCGGGGRPGLGLGPGDAVGHPILGQDASTCGMRVWLVWASKPTRGDGGDIGEVKEEWALWPWEAEEEWASRASEEAKEVWASRSSGR